MRMFQRIVYIYLLVQIMSHDCFSQVIAGAVEPEVDSSFVDLNYDKWSLRLTSMYKHQNLLFSNTSGETVKYVPNDRTSAGVGFSYKNLVIDLGIRLLFNREDFTSRFDLQGELALKQHLVDVIVQRYKGFNKTNTLEQTTFRDDMRSWVLGMNYFYNFNHQKLSIRSVITGNRQQKKAAGSFLLGGFFSVQDLEADTSILTSLDGDFNEFAMMENSALYNVGVLGGYAFILPITKEFFFFGGVSPGIGLNLGHVAGTRSYDLRLHPMGKVNTRAALGYIGSRWYSGVYYNSDYFIFNLDHDNLFRYNIGKFKLVLGYKFNAKGTLIEDIFGE